MNRIPEDHRDEREPREVERHDQQVERQHPRKSMPSRFCGVQNRSTLSIDVAGSSLRLETSVAVYLSSLDGLRSAAWSGRGSDPG